MDELEISEGDLRAELFRVIGWEQTVDDPGAKTMPEWIELSGVPPKQIRWRIKEAVKQGRMERVKVMRVNERGQERVWDAYRIVGDENA